MAGSEKPMKIRIAKLAKEFNLSTETLIEFFVKRGFEVKGPNSAIGDDMLEIAEKHYKKEKNDAERHARKKREYDEQDRKRKGEKPEIPQPKDVDPSVLQEPEIQEIVETVVHEEAIIEIVEETEIEAVEPVEELPVPEVEVVEVQTLEIEPVEEEVVVLPEPEPEEPDVEEVILQEEVSVAEPEIEPVEVVLEATIEPPEIIESVEDKHKNFDVTIESSMPKMGLTVKGKIDLRPIRK